MDGEKMGGDFVEAYKMRVSSEAVIEFVCSFED